MSVGGRHDNAVNLLLVLHVENRKKMGDLHLQSGSLLLCYGYLSRLHYL